MPLRAREPAFAQTCSTITIPNGHAQASANPAWSAADAAGYIADLSQELAVMARGVRLDLVAYLLEMAQLEAKRTTTHLNTEAPKFDAG
jgi:hypothetical protein